MVQDLLAYFERIAERREPTDGAVRLVSPRCPVIAANAAYPTAGRSVPPAALADYRRTNRPLIVAGEPPGPEAREVLRVRSDTVNPGRELPGGLVVEQVSRLQSVAAEVLCAAWGTPDWAGLTGRWLSEALEGTEHQLLVGYADAPVGMALVLDGAAHLWGCVRPELSTPFLQGVAGACGEQLRVSVPVGGAVRLQSAQEVTFWMAGEPVAR